MLTAAEQARLIRLFTKALILARADERAKRNRLLGGSRVPTPPLQQAIENFKDLLKEVG